MALINEYKTWLEQQGYARHSVRVKLQAVRTAAAFADVEPEDLAVDDVAAWIASKPRAPRTRIKYLEHVSAFCKWAGVEDVTEGLRRPRQPLSVPRPIDESSLAAMLDVAPDRTRAWIVLGAYCGLRSFESAKVAGRDLEQASDGAWLLRVLGKGGQTWVVPAPRLVVDELAPWRRAAGEGRLWPRASALTVQRAIKAAGEQVGTYCTSHMLRHRYGTAVYAVDRDLLRTQRLMRHRSPATTAGYALVADHSLAQLVEQLPGAARAQAPDEVAPRHLRVVR